MAKPQKENGFTPIANEILEQIVKLTLNGTQLRILLVVWRYTYGFSRKEHDFSETFIVKATGISKRHVSNEIGKLISQNVLAVVRPSTYTTARKLRFNKDYDSWNSGTKVLQVNNTSTVEQYTGSTVEQSFTSTVEQLFHQERNIKENIKEAVTIENSIDKIGNLFFELTGRFANENDFVAITKILESYSDIEVITKVMTTVTEKKRKKDPQDKIKSFSFFVGAIEDEFKKIEARKIGESIGGSQQNSAADYDYSKLMYKGTPGRIDEDIDF